MYETTNGNNFSSEIMKEIEAYSKTVNILY